MLSTSNLNDNQSDVSDVPVKRPLLAQAAAVICAVVATLGLFAGYVMLQKRNVARFAAPHPDVASAPASPEAEIFEDEAMPRGANAVIGGTIRNTSSKELQALSVELELMRRDGTGTETRLLNIEPKNLAPGETGRYLLSVPTREWSGARVASLRSEMRSEAITYKSTPGARRPPERAPQNGLKSGTTPRPAPRNDEFINTPDNPTTIR